MAKFIANSLKEGFDQIMYYLDNQDITKSGLEVHIQTTGEVIIRSYEQGDEEYRTAEVLVEINTKALVYLKEQTKITEYDRMLKSLTFMYGSGSVEARGDSDGIKRIVVQNNDVNLIFEFGTRYSTLQKITPIK